MWTRSKGKAALDWFEQCSDSSSGEEELDAGHGDDEQDDIMHLSAGSSRSSVKYVVAAVTKFNEEKKNLVRSIGFGGILEIPQINKVSRRFTVWLLSKLDPATRTIVVDGEQVTDMVDKDVGMVMGIPCGPQRVSGLEFPDSKSRKAFMQQALGIGADETNILVAAGSIIRKDYPGQMTHEQRDHFKVAFVIFVVGHLLAPTTKNKVGNTSFWGALKNPSELHTYNWGEYVIQHLVEAAVKVQTDIKTKKRVSNVTGCSIFLQILYLDALDLKGIPRPDDVVPRIKAYNCSVLKERMEADQANSSSGTKNRSWGTTLAKAPDQNRTADENLAGWAESYGPHMYSFIRESFGGKLNESQRDAILSYTTRCAEHLDKLKTNMMEENLVLMKSLLATSGCTNKTDNVSRFKSNTAIQGKRSNGYQSADEGFSIRRRPRSCIKRKRTEPVETILSGGSLPSDSGLDTGNMSQGHGGATEMSREKPTSRIDVIEPPSFDLGIDFQTQQKYMNAKAGAHDQLQRQNNQNAPDGPCLHTQVPAGVVSNTPTNTIMRVKGVPLSNRDQQFQTSSQSPGSLSKIFAGCEVMGRILLTEDEINMNVKPWDHDTTESPVLKHKAVTHRLAKSPWFYALNHDACTSTQASRIAELAMKTSTDQKARAWIICRNPRFLEITGQELLTSFSLLGQAVNSEPLSYELFDVALLRLIQMDNKMYQKNNDKRWRHILFSDLAMLAQAEEDTTCRKSVREQFLGNFITHEVSRCRMIVVPAQVLKSWSCYFFDFKKRSVHIVDPLYKTTEHDFYSRKHEGVLGKVRTELSKCIETFFDDWKVDWEGWSTSYVATPISTESSLETAFLSLFAIREFDGEGFRGVAEDSLQEFKKVFFCELLKVEQNEAMVPFQGELSKAQGNVVLTIDD